MVKDKIGIVIHYFTKIGVAAIKISEGELKIGDIIHIVGSHTDFKQKIDSMQIDGKSVDIVRAGSDVGIKLKDRVRENDIVYKSTEV